MKFKIIKNITYEKKPEAGVKDQVTEVKPGFAGAVSCGQVYAEGDKFYLRCRNRFDDGFTHVLTGDQKAPEGDLQGGMTLVKGGKVEIKIGDTLVSTADKSSDNPEEDYGLVTVTTTFELA